MKPFIAVMLATTENRLAKYMDFDTSAEAQTHIDRHVTNYPDAFVHASLSDALEHWSVNMVAKTLTFSPDTGDLNDQVKQAIRLEGMDRVQEFVEDADLEIATSIHLLFIRAQGATWTSAEQTLADKLITKFTYIRNLYITGTQAINNIPTMTEIQKLNFNAATDLVWPVL